MDRAAICPSSGQRPPRPFKYAPSGKLVCPKCGRPVYLTMKGKLYKHAQKVTRV